MPDQPWTTVDCRDWADRDRNLGLGRIRRGITLRTPSGETALFDLPQARALRAALDEAITDLHIECTPATERRS
ncbi:hypothetical protein [Haloactinomyces albus]|uniref:Uncharacterized protein n=1 Tax=Haloactinomyces albus TaxID=1352928 RepID=A0AAE3ZCA1_9ACTN|nr:hypothetical protein [Haloactinomyces albus]MDR7301051.1 hypothetical protein [Haloactinomyces albus]